MSEHAPDRIWSGIDIVKVLAGTLAAVSAAVVGSFLGVAGTLIGAALASLVGGIGQEVYARSLHRGVSRLRGQTVRPPVTAPAAMGTPSVATPATDHAAPGHFDPVAQRGAATPRRRWRLVAVPAIAFFVLAMAAVSAVEGIAGESFASMFGHRTASRSTVGAVLGGGSSKPTPTPSNAPTSAPAAKPGGQKPTGDAPPAGGTSAAPEPGQTGATPPGTDAAPQPTTDPGGPAGTPPGAQDAGAQNTGSGGG